MGDLIKIEETSVTSAVSTVTLGDNNWDSSYDVYMIRYRELETDSSSASTIGMRFLSSGNVDTSSNYDQNSKFLKSYTSPSNDYRVNQSRFLLNTINTANDTKDNGIMYLFNMNNGSEYSYYTIEFTGQNTRPGAGGGQGGGVLTVSSTHNGVQWYMDGGGNIDNGTFTLYGLKK
jgi:hypothetical protein